MNVNYAEALTALNDFFGETTVKYVAWIMVNIIGTLIARYSTIPISLGKVPADSWLRKVLILYDKNGITYFRITGATYSGSERAHHYRNLMFAYSFIFFYGNAINKYEIKLTDFLYFLNTYFTILWYGCLESVQGMNLSITPGDFPKYTPQFKIWLVFNAFLAMGLLNYHLYLAYNLGLGTLVSYLVALIAMPSAYFYWYFKLACADKNPGWHIHHWFIGWFCSMFWRFDDPISKLAFSFYYGIFLEGSSDGMADIIYNDGDQQVP